jgi:hypothetical protein
MENSQRLCRDQPVRGNQLDLMMWEGWTVGQASP